MNRRMFCKNAKIGDDGGERLTWPVFQSAGRGIGVLITGRFTPGYHNFALPDFITQAGPMELKTPEKSS